MKGSRLTNYMRLEMLDGHDYLLGKNYMYIDIPLLGVDEEDKLITSIKRNQHVFIKAAATVDMKGRNFIEVEPNQKLAEIGQVQGMYRLHPDSGVTQLGFYFTARKDVELSELEYAVRIYMPG